MRRTVLLMSLAAMLLPLTLTAEDKFPTPPPDGTLFEDYGDYRVCLPLTPDRTRGIYAIINVMMTDRDEPIEDLPDYLQYALHYHDAQQRDSFTYVPVLRYINLREFHRVIGTLFDDGKFLNNGEGSAGGTMTMLTGTVYNPDAEPIYEEGAHVPIRTRYHEMFGIEDQDHYLLSRQVAEGLYNIDPRIRLACLAILEAMGPHPYIQEFVREAMRAETIGHVYSNAPFADENNIRYRVRYPDISGCQEVDIPYRRFVMLDRQISRTRLVYYLEATQELMPEDVARLSAPLATTLLDDQSLLPNFPPLTDDIDAFEGEEDLYIPTNFYYNQRALLPEMRRINLLPLDNERVPALNEHIRNMGDRERFLDVSLTADTLVGVERPLDLTSRDLGPGYLSDADFLAVIQVYMGALQHPDVGVASKAAAFLAGIYEDAENYNLQESTLLAIYYAVRDSGIYNLDVLNPPDFETGRIDITLASAEQDS